MLKAIGFIAKVILFSLIVLVAGNAIHWRGKTISDQVKSQLAHAERSDFAQQIQSWTSAPRKIKAQSSPTKINAGEIPSSERKKLQELIRELNTSRAKD